VDIAEQVVSLLAVFGLLALAVWAFGRKSGREWHLFRKPTKAGALLLVADRLVLTPQHVLHLVRVGEKTVLLATHPQGVSFDPAGCDFSTNFHAAMRRTYEGGK
jgi:flagellar biogenesis protein FliO